MILGGAGKSIGAHTHATKPPLGGLRAPGHEGCRLAGQLMGDCICRGARAIKGAAGTTTLTVLATSATAPANQPPNLPISVIVSESEVVGGELYPYNRSYSQNSLPSACMKCFYDC